MHDRIRAASYAHNRAQAYLDFVAVCMVGTEGAKPRDFGDNRGAWPIRISTTKDPKSIAKKTDIESPLWPIIPLEYVWTESEQHAKRLKTQLDILLLGNGDNALRHAWKHADDPVLAWPILLAQALDLIRAREEFEVFDEEERQRRIDRLKTRFGGY